jgi:hypothetical protein
VHAFAEIGMVRYTAAPLGHWQSVGSRSGSPVGVAGWDATFAQFGQHGGVVDVEVFANPRE